MVVLKAFHMVVLKVVYLAVAMAVLKEHISAALMAVTMVVLKAFHMVVLKVVYLAAAMAVWRAAKSVQR